MDIDKIENIDEIKKWIKSFKKLMKKCPDGLWFFSNGELHIMAYGEDGEPVMTKYGVFDQNYIIDSLSSNYSMAVIGNVHV